ncbi:MAG: LytTR family transcriptional regulator [Lachnospiraceae bacterium]|nr:LytTR family transcriptional regulator [Lachnospiraceae bacterium]
MLEIVANREKIKLKFEDIIYIERVNRQINIVCRENEYLTYETLDKIKQKLPEYFIRCHTGFIINLNWIEYFSQNQIVMINNKKISVGRAYKLF